MAINRREFIGATAAAAGGLFSSNPMAQPKAYPDRPIKIIVPFAPGGGTDFSARIYSTALAERIGQPVIVENKPGAASTIGTNLALKSAPDGYTLLVISGSYVVNPSLYKLDFDPVQDITPIIQLTESGYVLAVNAKFPAKNLAELIEMMRARPGEISYASSGQGGHLQVVTEYMLGLAKVKAKHIPYRGTGPGLADLLAGTVDMMFGGTEAIMQHVAAGKLRALAVGTPHRLSAFPDVPTVAEAGVPGYDVVAWHGMIAPKGIPPHIVALLNRHMNEIVHDQALKKKTAHLGVDGFGGTPDQFQKLLKLEVDRYAQVIRDANIRAGS
ncbi:tripartite tricarboxylate transporter substrate binding protein [Diaphorobacter sp. HDW4A]|uniref:Bug family tripartite tricarboxylate transporter substrate binding protein n=1 Tax=Diaphorobacter sp. HDW4A TaxID=2714924 RepID=UPI001409125D|nr:tripartite tricarboxylate transporter substrate binding protein [Diaphorobacter sp. HDW4A]QIL79354.1 tripartite tricarboxylate transporter substrate binding protein [Diaphorobacter sp. HDW4A]